MVQSSATRWRLASVSAAFLISILSGIAEYSVAGTRYLHLELRASVPSIAQVFYDVGRGFNERDSKAAYVAGTGTYQSVDLQLPTEPIRDLRLDPLTGPGTVVVRTIEVRDGADHLLGQLSPAAIVPLSGTRVAVADGGTVIEALPPGTDPATSIRLPAPLVFEDRAALRGLRAAALALAIALPVALLLLYFVRPSNPFIGTARHAWMFLVSEPVRASQTQIPWIALGLLMILIVIRAPHLFSDPRFWAEEGTVWFQHAIRSSVPGTVLFIFHESGYFNLYANIAAALSGTGFRIAGPEVAPLITTLAALAAQLLCFVVVLWGRSRLFAAWWQRFAACLIILLSPVAVGEIWLNSINSMSYLGLFTLLVLFEDSAQWQQRTKWMVRGILCVAGLSGVYSVALVPLFVAAWMLYRNRESAIQAGVLIVCAGIQFASMTITQITTGIERSRFTQITLDSALVNVFFNHVCSAFFGPEGARAAFNVLGMNAALAGATAVPRHGDLVLAGWFSLFAIAAILWTFARPLTRETALLTGCVIVFSTLTALASLNGIPAGRYAFLPGVSLLFLVAAYPTHAPSAFGRIAAVALLCVSLSCGVRLYRTDPCISPVAWGAPSWSAEVARWRETKNSQLRVWPSWWAGRLSMTAQ